MKRIMSVMGYLGADPETKTSKTGNQYIQFRLANQAYGDPENETCWITVTVTSANSRAMALAKTLKKGYCIEVTGDFSDKVYMTKDGKPGIGRDLNASLIYFCGGASKRDESQNYGAPVTESNIVQKPQQIAKPVTRQPQVVVSQTPVAQDYQYNGGIGANDLGVMPTDDELPF